MSGAAAERRQGRLKLLGCQRLHLVVEFAPVAHRTERAAPDRKAAGSIPAGRTFSPRLERPCRTPSASAFAGPPDYPLTTGRSGRVRAWFPAGGLGPGLPATAQFAPNVPVDELGRRS
jgi:hypothetical protein